jgi:hypothetical protein
MCGHGSIGSVHILYITYPFGCKHTQKSQPAMADYGLDTNELPSMCTLTVYVLSIFLMCIPFALHGGEASEGSSVLFISLPPEGNQTIANEALVLGIKPGVLAFEFQNHFWVHVICVAAGIEALLLWAKVGTMTDSLPFTHTTVISIGGLYTANNEFWFFVGLHHVVLIMVLLSPMSLHALFLFTWCVVCIISIVCEPSDDNDDDSPHGEVHCNRVVFIFFYVFILCCLFVVDARMNRKTIGDIPWFHTDLLFTQILVDILLISAAIQVDIITCYYARLMYTLTCGGIGVCFLAWA